MKNLFPHLLFHLLDVVWYHIIVIRVQLSRRGIGFVYIHRRDGKKALQVSAEDSLHDDLTHDNGKHIFTVRYSHFKEYVDILT